MAGGQPTKYKEEYCQDIIDFFDIEPLREVPLKHYQKDGKTLSWVDIKLVPNKMPTINKFSKKIGVCVRTVYNWIDRDHDSFQEEFLQALTCAKAIRRDWLIDLGLSGATPPNSFKFVAINCTDMVDKQETKHGVTSEAASLLGLLDGSGVGKLPSEDKKE